MEIKFTGAGKIQRITIPDDKVFRGDMDLSYMELTELPDLSDVTVTGNFDCSANALTSLKGAPKSVGGNFDCSDNCLASLAGVPQTVGGDFLCSSNPLTTLAGMPQTVWGYFCCSSNQLTTLAGAPKSVGKHFDCSGNLLTTLAGAPQTVGGDFDCRDNRLVGLSHEICGNFICDNQRLVREYEKIKQMRLGIKQKGFLIRLFGRLKQNMK